MWKSTISWYLRGWIAVWRRRESRLRRDARGGAAAAAAESIQLEVLVDDEDARLEVVHLAQHQRMVFIELRLQKEKMSKRKDE